MADVDEPMKTGGIRTELPPPIIDIAGLIGVIGHLPHIKPHKNKTLISIYASHLTMH